MPLNIGELVGYLKLNKVDWDRGKASAKRDLEDIADEAEKSGKKIDRSTKDAAKKTESNFSAMKFAGLTAGLPAAAAVGAAAVAGSLVLMTAGFAAFGVAAVAKSDAVQDRLGVLSSQFKADAETMSAPLQDDVVGAIDDIGAAWVRLRPLVASAVQASAPQIRELTGAATDLAENAMPGVLTAVRAAGPVFQGVRAFAGAAGQGISEFAANASKGAQGADTGLTILGGTVRTVESRLGSLFANAANGSAGPLRSLDVIVDQVSGGLVDLTAQGSGAMGVLQGFSTTGSGLVTVLRGVATVVSALPEGVTQYAGSIGAASMLTSKFGLDASKSFEGLGSKIKDAKGAGDKLKTGLTGLAEGALSPASLATAGLGVALNILGHQQEIAAKYTAEHEAGVQRLTAAIRADNGVLGEHVKQANLDALTTKNAANNLAVFGENMGDAKLAIEGNTDAYDRLNYSARARLAVIAQNAQLDATDTEALKGLGTEALKTGKNYEQLTAASGRGAQVAQMLGGAWNDQINSILNANGAVGEQINQQKLAYETYLASEGALNDLSDAQVRNRDATAEATQEMYNQQNAGLGLRGAVLNTRQALEQYNKVSKDGKAGADDKAAALLRVEQAFAAEEEAARKSGEANSSAATDAGKAADGFAAMNARTVQLANSMAGQLPASLSQTIGKMDVTSAKAAGLTVSIDGTGAAVYRLPNGKFIAITSSAAEEAARVDYFQSRIDLLHGKTVTVTTSFVDVTSPTTLTGRRQMYADGGLVGGYANGGLPKFPTGGLFRGVGGPRADKNLIAISDREFIVNAAATAQNLPLLEAINSGSQLTPTATPVSAPASVGGAGRATTVNIGNFHPPANASPMDIAEDLDWLARTGG